MVVLIDANVALDKLTDRNEASNRVLEICKGKDVEGYFAFHSVSIVWYVLRFVPIESRRRVLKDLCEVLTVVGASHTAVIEAIENESFSDFEDCLQDACAQEIKADYIITRNLKDFTNSKVPAISPEEWLKVLLSES